MLREHEQLATRPSVKLYTKLRKSPSTPDIVVQKYEALKEVITTFHTEKQKPIDWGELATSSPPFTGEIGPNEARITKQINDYKPTWRDKLFNRVEARLHYWTSKIPQEKDKDKALMKQWEEQVRIAKLILNQEPDAWKLAMKMFQPSKEITSFKNQLDYQLSSNGTMVARMKLHSDILPNKKYTLTKTGKLSKRNMPKKEYYQLFQQYTHSCFARVAVDIFDMLPIDTIVIHINAFSTADEETGCILSAKVNRKDLEGIRNYTAEQLETLIDSLEHHQKFLKTKGFKVIKEVTA